MESENELLSFEGFFKKAHYNSDLVFAGYQSKQDFLKDFEQKFVISNAYKHDGVRPEVERSASAWGGTSQHEPFCDQCNKGVQRSLFAVHLSPFFTFHFSNAQ